MPGYGDLRALETFNNASPEVWLGPGQLANGILALLLARKAVVPDVKYGEVRQYLSPEYSQYVGVRDFARRNGLEDLLSWNPDTQQVTLGGYEVPYAFGYQGRTYADPAVLNDILRRIQELQGTRSVAPSNSIRDMITSPMRR